MFRTQLREAREEGFTLIELLIVIVVLGVLAGIVVFGVAQFQQDAEVRTCESNLKVLNTASYAYRAAEGNYAAGANAAAAIGVLMTDAGSGEPYLKEDPSGTITNLTYTAADGTFAGTCP